MDREITLTEQQLSVLAAFEKKFCKIKMTNDPRMIEQFKWLWRKISNELGRTKAS